ncbi:unnamed protein product [Peniophora sp. CBMAI 1063]|nr:unnamed protein product [Peniophora sp. CBMAI 1063]
MASSPPTWPYLGFEQSPPSTTFDACSPNSWVHNDYLETSTIFMSPISSSSMPWGSPASASFEIMDHTPIRGRSQPVVPAQGYTPLVYQPMFTASHSRSSPTQVTGDHMPSTADVRHLLETLSCSNTARYPNSGPYAIYEGHNDAASQSCSSLASAGTSGNVPAAHLGPLPSGQIARA